MGRLSLVLSRPRVNMFLVVSVLLALLSGCWSANTPQPPGVAWNKADNLEGPQAFSPASRHKRSLGLLANMFNRIMFSEVQDAMEENTPEEDEAAAETIELVRCELVLESKTCRIGDTESVCENHFGRQCFLYTYPSTTVTVEKRDETRP